MASQAVSSGRVPDDLQKPFPKRCFNVKRETKGIKYPDDTWASLKTPFHWVSQQPRSEILVGTSTTSWKFPSTGELHSTIEYSDFLLYENETFQFEYPYCDPANRIYNENNRTLECGDGLWRNRNLTRKIQTNGTSKSFVLMQYLKDQNIYLHFSLTCEKLNKDSFLDMLEVKGFHQLAEREIIPACLYFYPANKCEEILQQVQEHRKFRFE
jgi:hypothetical protein